MLGKAMNCALFLAIILLPLSIVFGYVEPVKNSKATYYLTNDGLGSPNGACGYGEYGRTVNDGSAASSSTLYREGAGCGACYMVKCKRVGCNPDGVLVMVTDGGGGGDADFVLSAKAYNKMALPGFEKELMSNGVVDIEYRRVPCQFPGKTLMLKVLDYSHYRSYLSFQFLNQAGASDITDVQVYEEESQQWRSCRRAYGAVWDISNPPRSDLTIRFFVDGGATSNGRWVQVPNLIPAFWQPGVAYDTEIQLDEY